jgi:hypothetical protein
MMEELWLDRKERITIEDLARETQGTKILGIILEIEIIVSIIQRREVLQKEIMIKMTSEIIILHILTIHLQDSNNSSILQENSNHIALNAE